MNSIITREVRIFAEKLPFGQEGRSEGLAVFEETWKACVEEDDYMIVLSILSFSEGRPNMDHVCEFLETCLTSPFEEVRKLAAVFPLSRALKTSVGKARLLGRARTLVLEDPSEGVRSCAFAALYLAGFGDEKSVRSGTSAES